MIHQSPQADTPSGRPQTVLIQGEQMWDALASPVRTEMLEHLEAMGETTVAELASAMDRAADGLYHHVHVMEQAGIVLEVGKRASKRRPETVYALAGARASFDLSPDQAGGFVRVMKALLATVARRVSDAVCSGTATVRGRDATAVFRVETAWLTDEESRRVRAHLKQVVRIVHASRRRERAGKRHTIVVAGVPTETKQRAFSRPSQRTEGDGDEH